MTRHPDSGAPFLLDSWGILTSCQFLLLWGISTRSSCLGHNSAQQGEMHTQAAACTRVLQRAFGKVELEDNFGAIYAEHFHNAPFPRTFWSTLGQEKNRDTQFNQASEVPLGQMLEGTIHTAMILGTGFCPNLLDGCWRPCASPTLIGLMQAGSVSWLLRGSEEVTSSF